MEGTWTIGELAERASAALAAEGATQVSGRVRDLPNARLIRWYTTIGLIDPPLGRRGRTALYGPRHLLQLVAVKRRQAEGRSIAEIQLELAAAPDETLARIAALPETALPETASAPAAPAAPATPGAPASGAPAPPTDHRTSTPTEGESPATITSAEDPATAPSKPSDTTRPAASPEQGAVPRDESSTPPPSGEASPPPEGAATADAFWKARPDVSYRPATVAADYGRPRPPVVQGVRLAQGVTLLLDGSALTGDDLAAIETAARPLLDVLHRRGLLAPAQSPASPSEAHLRRSP
ncbi:MerR HTH family regulatory protein [Actinomadura meyerae]|uniref:MerR HTH family regulatory protein n=1 Tax=Actinomadura meyerae TaxID=240840 RepID=A0A239MVC8_9ACTN|nr:MerR family transcriptional regulator [Actinomadura meyerae]SNT46706.1 MerR HTH family regulatory protein [Actinomadura meyerae]